MAAITSVTKLRFREDTSANWATANPILGSSEPGRETNTGYFKIGDGVTRWLDLPYQTNTGSVIPECPDTGNLYGRTRNAGATGGNWEEISIPVLDTRKVFADLLEAPYDISLNMGYSVVKHDGTTKQVYGIKKYAEITANSNVPNTSFILTDVDSIIDFGGTFMTDSDHEYVLPANSSNYSANVNLSKETNAVSIITLTNEVRVNAPINVWLLYTKI